MSRIPFRASFFESKRLPSWDRDDPTPAGRLRTYGGILGRAVGSATVMRHAVYALSALAVMQGAANIWLLTKQPQVEVVAAVLDGHSNLIATFEASTLNPATKPISVALAHMMKNIRGITPDKTRMRDDWEYVQSIMAAHAYSALRAQLQEEGDPILARPDEARIVSHMRTKKTSFNEKTGEGTVHLEWREQDFIRGSAKPVKQMTGEVSFTTNQPKNKTQALANPLGLWVTHVSFEEG